MRVEMAGAKVLIVEDEWLIGEDLKLTLEKLGYEVLGPALTCAAALEIIWNDRPQLALVDTELGHETCEVVLDECRLQNVPVVITSGHSRGERPDFAASFPYVSKPYDSSDIERAVAERLPALKNAS